MSIIERYRRSQPERTKAENIETAASLFQIMEYDGEIWFIYDNNLVCPCSMLKDAPVDAVKQMRELYIKMKEKK